MIGEFTKNYPIVFGQILSPLLAISAVCADRLAKEYALQMPCFQNSWVYLFLAIVYMICPMAKHRCQSSLNVKEVEGNLFEPRNTEAPPGARSRNSIGHRNLQWKKYLTYAVIALLDVNGNVLVVLAFTYTSLTSVMILDCFTIPISMLFSYFILGTSYSRQHFCGVIVCVVGLIGIIFSDETLKDAEPSGEKNRLLGDALVILGSCCYAASNVLQEYFVKLSLRKEFLGFIGLFGFIVAIIESISFENYSSVSWKENSLYIFLLSYILVMVAYYILVSIFLEYNDAAFLNINILTTDFYGMVLSYFLFQKEQQLIYIVAFLLVLLGAFVFNITPVNHTKLKGLEENHNFEQLSFSQSEDFPELESSDIPLNQT